MINEKEHKRYEQLIEYAFLALTIGGSRDKIK